MKGYRIKVFKIEKPRVRYIKCFLANENYVDNRRELDYTHRTIALAWYCVQEDIEKRIKACGNVRQVVNEELFKFELVSGFVIPVINNVAQPGQVKKMKHIIQGFIKQSIYNMYD